MSFQIYFTDRRQRLERIRVCVANSEEEFRNTTVEELKRKLIPEDQLADAILRYRFKTLKKNRTLGFYGIKHEDYIIAVRRRIPGSAKPQSDSSPVHESGVENAELHNCDLETLEEDHTLGFGIKHEDEVTAFSGILSPSSTSEWAAQAPKYRKYSFFHRSCSISQDQTLLLSIDEDEDEDKVIPRSQSMDNLRDMNQPQLKPSE